LIVFYNNRNEVVGTQFPTSSFMSAGEEIEEFEPGTCPYDPSLWQD
jgi:hypothetical protein